MADTLGAVLDVVKGLVEGVGSNSAEDLAKEKEALTGENGILPSVKTILTQLFQTTNTIINDKNLAQLSSSKITTETVSTVVSFINSTSQKINSSSDFYTTMMNAEMPDVGKPEDATTLLGKMYNMKCVVMSLAQASEEIWDSIKGLDSSKWDVASKMLGSGGDAGGSLMGFINNVNVAIQDFVKGMEGLTIPDWFDHSDILVGGQPVYKKVTKIGLLQEGDPGFDNKKSDEAQFGPKDIFEPEKQLKEGTPAWKLEQIKMIVDNVFKQAKLINGILNPEQSEKKKEIEFLNNPKFDTIKKAKKYIEDAAKSTKDITDSIKNINIVNFGKIEDKQWKPDDSPGAKVTKLAEFFKAMKVITNVPKNVNEIAVMMDDPKNKFSTLNEDVNKVKSNVENIKEQVGNGFENISNAIKEIKIPEDLEKAVKKIENFNKALTGFNDAINNIIKVAQNYDKISYDMMLKAMTSTESFIDTFGDMMEDIGDAIEDLPTDVDITKLIGDLNKRLESTKSFFEAIVNIIKVVDELDKFKPRKFKKKAKRAQANIVSTMKMIYDVMRETADKVAKLEPNDKEKMEIINKMISPIKQLIDLQKLIETIEIPSARRMRKRLRKIEHRIWMISVMMQGIVLDLKQLEGLDDGAKAVQTIKTMTDNFKSIFETINGMKKKAIISKLSIKIITKAWESLYEMTRKMLTDLSSLDMSGSDNAMKLVKMFTYVHQILKIITKMTVYALIAMAIVPMLSKSLGLINQEVIPKLTALVTGLGGIKEKKIEQSRKNIRAIKTTMKKFVGLALHLLLTSVVYIILGKIMPSVSKGVSKIVTSLNTIVTRLNKLKKPTARGDIRRVQKVMVKFALLMGVMILILPVIMIGSLMLKLATKMIISSVASFNIIIARINTLRKTERPRRKLRNLSAALWHIAKVMMLIMVLVPLIAMGFVAGKILSMMMGGTVKLLNKLIFKISMIHGTGRAKRKLASLGSVLGSIGIIMLLMIVLAPLVMMGTLAAVVVLGGLMLFAILIRLASKVLIRAISLEVLIALAFIGLVLLGLLILDAILAVMGMIPIEKVLMGCLNALLVLVALVLIGVVLVLLGVVAVFAIPAMIPALIFIGLVLIMVLALLLTVVFLKLLELITLDPNKIKDNVRTVLGVAMDVIMSVFAPLDEDTSDKSDPEQRSMIEMIFGGVTKLIGALLGSVILILTLVSVVAILIIAVMLLILSWIPLESLKKGRDNAVAICAIANDIMREIFKPENEKIEKSSRGPLSAIIMYVGGRITKILDAIFALAYLAVMVIAVFCILLIAGMLKILSLMNPETIELGKQRALEVVRAAQSICNLVFAKDQENKESSNRGILIPLLSFFCPEIGQLLKAIFALAYLAVIMIAMLLITAIAGMLKILSLINPETIELGKQRALEAVAAVQSIINSIFQPDEANKDESSRGILGILIEWISPEIGKLVTAIFALAFLAIALVAMLLVLAIVGILAAIAAVDPSTMDQARNNAIHAIDTVKIIIDLVIQPDDANQDGSPRNKGLFDYVIEALGLTWLKRLIDAILTIAFLALSIIAMLMVLSLCEIMKDIAKLDPGMMQKAKSNAITAVQTAMAIIDQIFQPGESNEKEGQSWLKKLLKWVLPTSMFDIIDAIVKIGRLALMITAVNMVAKLAEQLNTIARFNVSSYEAKRKTGMIMDATKAILSSIVNFDIDLDYAKKKLKGLDEAIIQYFQTLDKIKSAVNKLREVGKMDDKEMAKGQQDTMQVLIGMKAQTNMINGINANTSTNKKIDILSRIQTLVKSMGKFTDKDVKNNKEIIKDYCMFLDKIDKTDAKKLKSTEMMTKHMADLARKINGNFNGLAKALNEHIAPALDKLNQTMDQVTQVQQQIIDDLTKPITINVNGSASMPGATDTAAATDGTTPAADGTTATDTAAATDNKDSKDKKTADKGPYGSGGGSGSGSSEGDFAGLGRTLTSPNYEPESSEGDWGSPFYSGGTGSPDPASSTTTNNSGAAKSAAAMGNNKVSVEKQLRGSVDPKPGKKYVVTFAEVKPY